MTLAQLVTGIGYATLDSGEQISAETARLLACDADVIPAVLDSKGQVLDLGRTTRFFTAAQRHALGIPTAWNATSRRGPPREVVHSPSHNPLGRRRPNRPQQRRPTVRHAP
ncbi:DUF222 domain-containing protein [Actinopolymorpha alba]|uniref:DUF222 domain-containing protein n=1 Tax=Actinopolymorpha alba TaxID=533267 RepID=UPI002351EB24|nr:DUF222 domain-containing protein [Actinopolymorpha alba]